MWIIAALIIAVYLMIHFILPSSSDIGAYFLQPMMWLSLAFITFLIAQKEGLNITKFKKIKRWPVGSSPIQTGILVGGFQVSLFIIAGIFFGFGRSPYSFVPMQILINLFFVSSLLVGTELCRSYLIKKTALNKKYSTLGIILITILFLIIQIPPDKFLLFNFTNPAISLEFIGKTVITSLSISLLASYLSYLGGATASIGYMGILMGFDWFSPILPDPHWTIAALLGTIAPAVGYIIIQSSSLTPKEIRKAKKIRKKSSGPGWTIVAIFCLLIVFFSFGYMGVKPTVISSGSMQPALGVGDISLVEKPDIEELKVGDIIQYINEQNDTIMHRIVQINITTGGKRIFITKGDANELPDTPSISEKRIIGKSIFTIPKIGLIQIYVRNLLKSINIPIN